MAEAIERARKYKQLQGDEVFMEALSQVKTLQTNVFLDTSATIEAIQEAHDIVKGVTRLEQYIQSVIDAGIMYENKHS